MGRKYVPRDFSGGSFGPLFRHFFHSRRLETSISALQEARGAVDQKPPGEEDQTARLKRLGDRLREIDRREEGEQRAEAASQKDMSGLARGLRISTEFAAGVIVGVALGWACDRYFGTTPWGLIVFMLLGFAAGMMNIMRSAGVWGPPPSDGGGR